MPRESYDKRDSYRPFSNGTEHMMWLESNCGRGEKGCRNYRPNATSSRDGCPIEVAIALGSATEGTIPARIGLRGGFLEPGPNGRLVEVESAEHPGCKVIPACPEFRGYDEPDDRPQRGPQPPKEQLDLLDPRNAPDRGGRSRMNLEHSDFVDGRIMELRRGGLALQKIAAELGVSVRRVRKTLDPEGVASEDRDQNARRRAVKRKWDRTEKARKGVQRRDRTEKWRGRCERCGGLKGIGSERQGRRLCDPCNRAVQHEGYEARLDQVEEMYCAGLTYAQISAALGMNHPKASCPYVVELRKRGRVGRRIGQEVAA